MMNKNLDHHSRKHSLFSLALNKVGRSPLFVLTCLLVVIPILMNTQRIVIHIQGWTTFSSIQNVQYIESTEPALIIDTLKSGAGPEFDVQMDFRVSDNNGYPNLLQTDVYNTGLRVEISGSTMAVIINNANDVSAPNVKVLADNIKIGEWYSLNISGLKDGEVEVYLKGLEGEAKRIVFSNVIYGMNDIRIGEGFNSERRFTGDLRNIFIEQRGVHSRIFAVLVYAVLLLIPLVPLMFYLCASLSNIRKLVSDTYCKCAIAANASLLSNSWGYIKIKLAAPTTRSEKIVWVTTIIVIGFLIACFFHYYQGLRLGKPYPYNSFLTGPANMFGDWAGNYTDWLDGQFRKVGYGVSYLPGAYLVINLFTKMGFDHSLYLFLFLFLSFYVYYTYLNVKTASFVESSRNTLILTFMSYPLLFEMVTANFEAVIFICLAIFVILYQQGKYKLSTVPLAFAISAKLFPAVFLVLFLADKKYKELPYLILWTIFFMLLPLLIFDGGIMDGSHTYINNFLESVHMYNVLMVYDNNGLHFGHSLYFAIKLWFYWGIQPSYGYLAFALFVFLLLSIYVVVYEKEFWKRIAILVISMCLLPYCSTDYKLIHFAIPLYLLINANPMIEKNGLFGRIYIILFSLIMIPKSFYYLHDNPYHALGTLLSPLIMVIILMLIVGSKFMSIRDHSFEKTA